MSNTRPFKVLQMIDSNIYVINFSLDFGISSTLNIKDLVVYNR
jgi:hypothetical protein